ncbi:hypothetical protein BDW72DRAFT_179909 [Aspergillus terricola var. indicus]
MKRQKQARTNRWIAHDTGLSVQEAMELKEAHNAFVMTRRQSLAKKNHGRRTTNGAPGTEPGCSSWAPRPKR